MPATLTATPNPVGVWAEIAGGTTKITWNTGRSARGRVYLSRFTFLFGAGDADTRSGLSKPWPEFRSDISDDDSSIFNPGFLGLGPVPTAGTGTTSTFVAEQSWITQAFDIIEAGDGTIIPMSLNKLRGASSPRIYTLV